MYTRGKGSEAAEASGGARLAVCSTRGRLAPSVVPGGTPCPSPQGLPLSHEVPLGNTQVAANIRIRVLDMSVELA